MKIQAILTTLKDVMTKEQEIRGLQIDVTIAQDMMAEEQGLKKTIARCRLADAEKALAAKHAEIATLLATLPPTDAFNVKIYRDYVRYLLVQEELVAAKKVAEEELVAAKASSSTNTWKWSGRKEGPKESAIVTIAKKKIVELEAQAERNKGFSRLLCDYMAVEIDTESYNEEIALWDAGGPMPPRVKAAEDLFIKEMLEGCVSLPIWKVRA
jgi:hypothetical protein